MPLVFVFLLGTIFGGSDYHPDVGLVAPPGSPPMLVTAIEDSAAFSVTPVTVAQGQAEIQAGKLTALVELPVLPAGQPSSPATVTVVYPMQDEQQAAAVMGVIQAIVLQGNLAAAHVRPLFTVAGQAVAARGITDYVDFLVPGVMAMTVMQLGLFSTAIGLVRARESGYLKRLRVTPLPTAAYLLSRLVVQVVVAAAQTLLLLAVFIYYFHAKVIGSPWSVAGVQLEGVLVFVMMGMAVAGLATNGEAANNVSAIANIFLMFLSGIFWPLSMMPKVLQDIGRLSPLTYYAGALRGVMTGSGTSGDTSRDLIWLAVWGVVATVAAVRTYRFD